jgi:UPF0042 nucleotide-binding protein
MKDLTILIITGLSGSGKSTAIDALEDAGFFCVDNLPILLLPKFLELRSGSASEVQKLALGMDLREEEFIDRYETVFDQLRDQDYRLEILFLEASEEVLVKRYSQTRRQHPVARGAKLLDGIRTEREKLSALRAIADKIVDTSDLTVHQLKEIVLEHADRGRREDRMRVAIVSFGFKHGIPLEADLVMDVRFIPNPYFIPDLKNLDGKDDRVRRFVNRWPETRLFLDRYVALLEDLIPLYRKEGKSYLTIAVGCTGGRHRSVTIAEQIHDRLEQIIGNVTLSHRDIEMG